MDRHALQTPALSLQPRACSFLRTHTRRHTRACAPQARRIAALYELDVRARTRDSQEDEREEEGDQHQHPPTSTHTHPDAVAFPL